MVSTVMVRPKPAAAVLSAVSVVRVRSEDGAVAGCSFSQDAKTRGIHSRSSRQQKTLPQRARGLCSRDSLKLKTPKFGFSLYEVGGGCPRT